jgi:acyl carrier protein
MYRCDGAEGQDPPIGRPIANFDLYILDRQLQPVPVGVSGELHVGGVGLARGYLRRPDLTAERFVPHPFARARGERLYRTGDLCRFRPDGSVEFLGRVDHQVKVRGFRVEPGEIETALREVPGVQDVVVLAREDVPGDKRLVAYLAMPEGLRLPVAELRNQLRTRLPEFMIPSACVFLEAMPLTPSKKIDRAALPAPDQSRPELAEHYVPPRNETEEKLAAIASRLLNIERVGVEDNFFELGGHSLLATQFVSRVRDAFQVEMPLRLLFEKPTIAELAGEIQRLQSGGGAPQAPRIKAISRDSVRVRRSEVVSS